MRYLPSQFLYSGLTVVVDKLYRYDYTEDPATHAVTVRPLSGMCGRYWDDSLVKAGFGSVHRDSIEVRLLEDIDEPFLKGTKCVLCLGDGCVERLVKGATLGEQRGSPVMRTVRVGGSVVWSEVSVPFIFSYAPQDAQDRADYFGDKDEEDEGADSDAASLKSTHGRTRRREWKWWLRQDTMKAARVVVAGLRVVPEPRYWLYPTFDEVMDGLGQCREKMYFDWENKSGLLPTCMGFAASERDVFVAPMVQTHRGGAWYYGEEKTARILHRVGEMWLKGCVPVIHHAMYDLFIAAWRLRMPLPRRAFCTMAAFNRCYVEQSKSLGHVISWGTDLPYHKNEGVWEPHTESQADALYRYNGKDVYALTQIEPAILAEARKLGALESVELSSRMIVPYLESTLRGARVDWAALHERVGYNEKVMGRQLKIIETLAGYPMNPRSWKQVANHLYGEDGFGIKKPAKDPTNEKTLWGVQMTNKTELIPWILKYRQKSKEGAFEREDVRHADGSVTEEIPVVGGHKQIGGHLGFYPWEQSPIGMWFDEPRFTTAWKVAHTETIRRAASKQLGVWGNNWQNWAPGLRHCITADKGCLMGQVDEQGADAMIVAWMCRAGAFRDLYLNKMKPYHFLGLHLFKSVWREKFGPVVDELCGLGVAALKAHPAWQTVADYIQSTDKWPGATRYYYIAKKTFLSFLYGMGWKTFREDVLKESEGGVHLSAGEAKTFLEMPHALMPEVRDWQRETVRGVEMTRVLRNLFGHPHVVTGHLDESEYRKWYAFVGQSTVGQIIAYAVCELREKQVGGGEKHARGDTLLLRESQFRFMQDGHDAILFQCRAGNMPDVMPLVQSHVNRTMRTPRGEVLVMRSSGSVGENWGMRE